MSEESKPVEVVDFLSFIKLPVPKDNVSSVSYAKDSKYFFTKQMRLDKHQYDQLAQIKKFYANTYHERVTITWLVYSILNKYFSDPKNLEPRHKLLDDIAKTQPQGHPIGGMFSNLETFMSMTVKESEE